MNSITIKVIAFFLSSFIIITVISQVYFSLKDKKYIEEAVSYSISDTVSFSGIFVRNEKKIPGSISGVLNYICPDGSKLARNSVVAEVYSNEAQIENINKINSLNNELKLLQRVVNPGTTSVAQPEFISKQIDEKYLLIEDYIEHNQFDKVNLEKQNIVMLMDILNLVTNLEDKQVLNARIDSLNNEINSLSLSVPQNVSTIVTEEAGYFVSYVDGYEDKLNFDTIKNLSSDEINNITSQKIVNDTSAIGKIIDGYKWKIVGIINTSNAFMQGKEYNVKIHNSAESIPVYVESFTPVDENNNYKIVLSCDRLNYFLVQNRVEKVNIILNEYSGIKIPRKAINFQDGVRGVYVALGENIIFKKLDMIFECEDFILSKNTDDSNYVLLHDQIIFEEEKKFGASSSESTK